MFRWKCLQLVYFTLWYSFFLPFSCPINFQVKCSILLEKYAFKKKRWQKENFVFCFAENLLQKQQQQYQHRTPSTLATLQFYVYQIVCFRKLCLEASQSNRKTENKNVFILRQKNKNADYADAKHPSFIFLSSAFYYRVHKHINMCGTEQSFVWTNHWHGHDYIDKYW